MRNTLILTMAVTLLPLAGCMVGPNYKIPAAITAPSITYYNSACGISFAYVL